MSSRPSAGGSVMRGYVVRAGDRETLLPEQLWGPRASRKKHQPGFCPWTFSLGRCPRGNEEEAPRWLCRIFSGARCQLHGAGEAVTGSEQVSSWQLHFPQFACHEYSEPSQPSSL